MTKWQITTVNVCIIPDRNLVDRMSNSWIPDASIVWTKKDEKTGKTKWDKLKDLAADGWELVSVTPVNINGGTSGGTAYILYTLKKPMEE